MKVAVRYFSRGGNTKLMAETIAKEVGVNAVSVDSKEAILNEKADVLFIGGALYAYGIDEKLSDYIKNLDGDKVGEAVIFSTTWLSKHSIVLIKKGLEEKGIKVNGDFFYVRGTPNGAKLANLQKFAANHIK